MINHTNERITIETNNNNAITATQTLNFDFCSFANWFTVSYILSFLTLNSIQAAEIANKTTQYHRTKFQFFQSIIHIKSPNAHGATKIPDGVAFSGLTQIQITPPPTWNKAFPIQTKIVAHHGHAFSIIAHKATNQHPSKATNFGHLNLSVRAQKIVCNPNASILYISIAKNTPWALSSHLA